jgi:hypothetical protein
MSQPDYSENPFIPGTPYRVHDMNRPQPTVVDPGANHLQNGPAGIPSDAIVLFDGTSLSGWLGPDGGEAAWKVEDGYMEVVPGTGKIRTRAEFGDCQLHVEWASPSEVKGDGQGRGNSGVFMMGRYEIQILDCYNNPAYADGSTAAIYGEFPPLVNACRKPGEWQSLDIVWIAPKFDGEQLVSPARVTIFLNGIVVHHDTALIGPTSHRKLKEYEAHPPEGPLALQDHKDLVRFRNIWYRPLKGYDAE